MSVILSCLNFRDPMMVTCPARWGFWMLRIGKCAAEGGNYDHFNDNIGLDVYRDTISIAVADEGLDREIRFFGTVAND